MSSWRTVKLGDICRFKYGEMPKKTDLSDDGYPVFSGYRLVGHSTRYHYRESEIIVVARGVGGTGDIKMAPPFCFLTNLSIAILIETPDVYKPFLYYCLASTTLWELRTGSAQAQITIEHLKNYEVAFPPLPIQQRIAGILSAYDELIENSQRRIKILESMARALYREWFVHFRFPGHENHPRVASPLGEIPQGWERTTFAQAAVFENGDRGKNYPNGSDFVAEGIPFINAGHLADGAVDPTGMNYILEEKFAQLRSGKIRKGDLLFCLRGSPGRTARTAGLCRGAIASSLVIIRPTERANEAFLFYTLSGEIGKRMATELDNGAAQPNVSVGSIQKYPLLLPPIGLLNDYAKLIEPIWRHTEILRDQLSNLRKQRDLLLPRLLSGQIEVEAT
ncbi:restriction endonuclease subunit S [Propionivibrio sp.]|uniref:restriction endonuclease subunit S n=1 Tax=Propionivibrio sp. TaxID=2212460 RepID=UPI0026252F05|nr:restriction endonuclease subunit S [Propionivibrio sp.]